MTDERSIELEIEVPGTPEEVWAAIATGPGISSWFVPAQVEEHEGGKLTLRFGALGDDVATVEVWDPPSRLLAVSDAEHRGRRVACEYLVEARDRGTCVVRFVQSGFGTSADWDDEYHETEQGWITFFHNLRLYLTRFPGRRGWPLSAVVETAGPPDKAWASLASGLGLPVDLTEGQRVSSDDAAASPLPLAGTVERLAHPDGPHATIVLDQPAPGYAIVATSGGSEQAYVHVTAYLFGDDAEALAGRVQPALQTWMTDRFG